MTQNKQEKRAARVLAAQLGITYAHALRLIREKRADEEPRGSSSPSEN